MVTRLAIRFPGNPAVEVTQLVRAELSCLESAPVQNFVEILLERKVADRLRAGVGSA